MSLLQTRFHFAEKHTIGVLTYKGKFLCWTLEDTVRVLRSSADKVYGETAIPAGTYKLAVTMSPRFKRETPEIQGVPYFVGIRMHGGNRASDSEGCPLVARNLVSLKDGVIQGTWEKELTALIKSEKITSIKIVDAR